MTAFSRGDLTKALGQVDAALSKAQAHLAKVMGHPNAPQSNKLGHDLWDKIEALRHELVRRHRGIR